MCCRYYFSDLHYDDRVHRLLSLMDRDYPGQYKLGEIFPGDTAAAVLGEGGRLRCAPAVFGFPGYRKNTLLLNARAETAAEKPTFREAFRERRAVLPANGFYEWSHDGKKTKYLFTPEGLRTFYLCGVYKLIDEKYRFVILTRPANESMREVHDRMPVIAAPEAVRAYLTDLAAAQRLINSPAPFLRKEAAETAPPPEQA